jgi:hypothetical protein
MPTTTATELVDRYLAGWNETDHHARADLIERTWTTEARSVDPLADVTGRADIDAMMAGIQSQFPGHRFELDGGVVEHHDVVHWGWRLRTPDGTALMSGFDVATMVDGRIDFLAGFFRS